MAVTKRLCANCLEMAKPATMGVGPMQGMQLDPYQHQQDFQLCPICQEALTNLDYTTLHERYQTERLIKR